LSGHVRKRKLVTLVIAACAAAVASSWVHAWAEDLTVLSDPASARRVLARSLDEKAFAILARRERDVAAIGTSDGVERRRQFVREKLLSEIGGLPQRTPLNANTTGTIERDGYRIDKVIFESQPRLYVTANVYVPTAGTPPYPAIVVPLGHEANGKAHVATQRLAVTFARNGFVVLVFDPIGQGERVQLHDPATGTSNVEFPTVEHTLAGTQCALLGHSAARHFIWDTMRALDYLAERPEVDASRLGITGNSGGGTITALVAALDGRVKAAAPSCFITSWKRLLETMGPQDAEQNPTGFLADGLDFGDLIVAAAPKPYLILSATRDFFPIDGARATFQEAQRLYGIGGAGEKLAMFEADDEHGYSASRRAAAYRFMNRWLKGEDAAIEEAELEPAGARALACTETGQVSTSRSGETIFSIHRAEANAVTLPRAPVSTADELGRFRTELRGRVEQLLAFKQRSAPISVRSSGQVVRKGYRIDEFSFESERGVVVPALAFVPDGSGKHRAVLWVDRRGKAAAAAPGGAIERLVHDGAVVFAIDVRGTGETSEEAARHWSVFGPYKSAMTGLLLNEPLVGLRVVDVERALDVLAAREDVDMSTLSVVGRGTAAVVVLHAAALDDRIKEVTLDRMLVSYASAFEWDVHRDVLQSVVPGAFPSYDLPDLVASLAPRPVRIRNAVDARGLPMGAPDVERQYATARTAYTTAGASQSLVIRSRARRPT
jgi:cephalosporin-C deacetylase-like acetyl esterase